MFIGPMSYPCQFCSLPLVLHPPTSLPHTHGLSLGCMVILGRQCIVGTAAHCLQQSQERCLSDLLLPFPAKKPLNSMWSLVTQQHLSRSSNFKYRDGFELDKTQR